MSSIGFVGLGSMGAPIAGRLLQGHEVFGTNRTRDKATGLIERGLIWRDTPREVAAAASVVFSMVTDDAALAAITNGPDGILAGLTSGAVYVDMSTVSPQASRDLAGRVRALGASMIDAPVSGSVPSAGGRHARDHGRRPGRGVPRRRAAAAPAGPQCHARRRERAGPGAQARDQHQPGRADARVQRRCPAGPARRHRPRAGRARP